MKKLLVLLFLLPILSHAQTHHLGNWIGEDQGDSGEFIFSADGTAAIIHQQDTIGGQNYAINGMKMTLRYETDYTKSPYQINFHFDLDDGSSVQFMKGIFHLLDPETMELCADFEGKEFPKSFEKENTIVLSKQ